MNKTSIEDIKNGQEEKLTFKVVGFEYFGDEKSSDNVNCCKAILEDGTNILVDPFVGCAFKYENKEQLLDNWWVADGHWHESLKHNCPLSFLPREGQMHLLKTNKENYTPNTEVQKEREEAVRGFVKYVNINMVSDTEYSYLKEWMEQYLSQTKGGKE